VCDCFDNVFYLVLNILNNQILNIYDHQDFEAAKEFEPQDPRLVLNYRKVHSVACISLGPAGGTLCLAS
jgi:hypothetical protein